MEGIITYWPLIVAAIPGILSAAWAIAQLTENETDDRIVLFCRKLWSLFPVGETDPKKMGKTKNK